MNISGKTKIVGLFGYPVEHTLSPAMHNAAFADLGLDYCYMPFSVHPDRLPEAVTGLKALSLRGVNVTVPHKERVLQFLDEIDKEAAFIGAVNTIRNDEGRLTGFNTDGRGFMKSLSEAVIDVKDKKVLIIGAGGAARAIGYYLCNEAEKVFLYDVDTEKAGFLAQHLNTVRSNAERADAVSMNDKSFIGSVNIIINATPLGLNPEDASPMDVSLITRDHAVCDLIYKDTRILLAAAAAGSRTLNGLGMLLWQGVMAFEIWTGIKPPVGIMQEALLQKMAK
jgi:shikimate dehydrogenase